MALARAELEIARWASAGYSNGAIARERQTAIHTVARQVHAVVGKLGVGSRLGLATIPELCAWLPLRTGTPAADRVPAHSRLSGRGREVGPDEVGRFWREIAAGQWRTLAGVDACGMRHAVMSCDCAKAVDWQVLSPMQRDVLALVAGGAPQKVIALKLGMAPSTVSGALQRARKQLAFSSLGQLLRSYCAFKDVIDTSTRVERSPAQ
jgi:DNA-binding CsgD family transcriptional regulator